MAGSLFDWSTTAGDNDDSDSDINWIEGQAGATVNNSARAIMAKIAGLVRALKGSYTTAGSSTAYTLTVDFPPSSLASKGWFGLIRFHTANGATPSIDINSLGAVAIYMNDGAAPAVGELAEDSVHFVHYDTETSRLRVLTSGASALVADDISDFDSAVAALIVTIDEMTAETSPAVNDYLGIYDTSATAQRKMTFENFLKVINSLTEDTTPDTANDFLLSYDASASGVKKVKMTNAAPAVTGVVKAVRTQVFTASGTYTPDANLIYCEVIATGGGGGGGGADVSSSGNDIAGGGGGGAGGTAIKVFSAATIGASQTVTIGAAGAAGGATGTNGGAGGNTTFGALLTANGGALGTGSGTSTTGAGVWAGGSGGSASSGDINITGGSGGYGFGFDDANTPTLAVGCGGGASYWGGGGMGGAYGSDGGGTSSVPGSDGAAYGSGGGGACSVSTVGAAGGAGKAGVVLIREYCSA